jgi:hypothetical protein
MSLMPMQQIDNPVHNPSMQFKHKDQEQMQHFVVLDNASHLGSSLIIASATTTCSKLTFSEERVGATEVGSTTVSFFSDI